MLDKETCEERLHRTRLPIIDKAAKDIRLESTWMVIIYSQGGRVYSQCFFVLFLKTVILSRLYNTKTGQPPYQKRENILTPRFNILSFLVYVLPWTYSLRTF